MLLSVTLCQWLSGEVGWLNHMCISGTEVCTVKRQASIGPARLGFGNIHVVSIAVRSLR